jgi:hypothetical protein
LSARYSNSPALTLTVARSRTRQGLLALLTACVGTALYLVHTRGYPLLSWLCLPPAALALLDLARAPWAGTTLRWQGGRWSLQAGESRRDLEVLPASRCLPWVVYLAWREAPGGRSPGGRTPAGYRRGMWLFHDSAERDQLRRLRVRLALEPWPSDRSLSAGRRQG